MGNSPCSLPMPVPEGPKRVREGPKKFSVGEGYGELYGESDPDNPGVSTSPFAQLHADWVRLGATTTARRRLTAWVEAEPVLSGYGSPADLVGFAQRAEAGEAKPIEAALLRLAGADSFAARTLLQILVARLEGQGLERRPSLRGTEAVDDIRAEMLSHLWEAIVSGAGTDHDHPGRVLIDRAVGALRGQRRAARRRESRWVELASIPVATTELDDARTVAERVVLAVTEAHRRGRLHPSHARLLLAAAAGAPGRAVGTTAGPGLSRSVYYRLHLAAAAMARAQA